MRVLTFAVLVLASPALAQTLQEQVAEIVIADTVAQDIDQALAEQIATCVAPRMTDAEAAAFLEADGAIEQQGVIASMEQYQESLLCIAEAIE